MIENYINRDLIPGVLNKIVFIILGIISVVWIINGVYPAILLLIFVIVLLFSFRGVQIDLKEKKYRSYLSILGFKTGEYKPLPEIKYVLVKDTIFLSRNRRTGSYSEDDNYEISLMCEGNLKLVLLYSYDTKETILFAQKSSLKFKCQIKDSTKEQLLKGK